MVNKTKLIANIFTAAAIVGSLHYIITGFENGINSIGVGLTGGLGALVMDIVTTFRSSNDERKSGNSAPNSESNPQ